MGKKENTTQIDLVNNFLLHLADELTKEFYKSNHYIDTPNVAVNQEDYYPKVLIDLPVRPEDLGRGLMGTKQYTHIFSWHCRGKSGKPGKETSLAPYDKNPFDYVIGLSSIIDIIEKNINPLGPKQDVRVWLGVFVPPESEQGIVRFIKIFLDKNIGKILLKANWVPQIDTPKSRTGLISGLQNQQIVGQEEPSDIDLTRMSMEDYTNEMDRRRGNTNRLNNQDVPNYGYVQPQIKADRSLQDNGGYNAFVENSYVQQENNLFERGQAPTGYDINNYRNTYPEESVNHEYQQYEQVENHPQDTPNHGYDFNQRNYSQGMTNNVYDYQQGYENQQQQQQPTGTGYNPANFFSSN